MIYFVWAAALFLFALTVYMRAVSKKAACYVGIGGKGYNKPIPRAMREEQREIYRQIYGAQRDKGMSEGEASGYAMRMAASIDPSAYGLKEKPFRRS
tara:strand:+ start:82 stop:372 length:291 start_codon:yes stop_codon:yes gene_type:complete